MFEKKREARTRRAVNLLFLEEALQNAGQEYSFFANAEPDEKSRAYMRNILVKILAPAAAPANAEELLFGRYLYQTAYAEKERVELDGLAVRLKNIFQTNAPPEHRDVPAGRLEIYLSHLLNRRRAFENILSALWHGQLKAGDRLNAFFPDHIKTETLDAFRLPPLPPLFGIEGNEIILNEVSEKTFLFLLSGLLIGRLADSDRARALSARCYLHAKEYLYKSSSR